MNKEQRESPNDEDNPFVTLASLIDEKTSIATLASAIEQEGIFTWDKYGRWGKASIDDENRALHLLEIYYKWEETPPEEPTIKECGLCQMTIPIKATKCGHCTAELKATA